FDASSEAIALFNHYSHRERIPITRIIAARPQAETLHNAVLELRGKWKKTRTLFPEAGMRIDRDRLTEPREPALELALPEDAEEIARGSARAMLEELNLATPPEDLARLVRSKLEIIEKRRYYLLRSEGEIVFQAYLSASLPEVGQ